MKITLYWSYFSNRIFYVNSGKVYLINGVPTDFTLGDLIFFQKIGEI